MIDARAQEKTAGEAYKNVEVFQDVPQSQLLQAMFFMEASLGVSCTHCHVDYVNFDKDDRPAKVTARRMIMMVRGLNQREFGGRTVITCNTCHRGQATPAAALPFASPSAPVAVPKPAEPSVLPTVDELFERYLQATGGPLELGRVRTQKLAGTKTSSEGWTAPLEAVEKGDDAFVTTFQLGGAWSRAFDGAVGWAQDNHGVHALVGRDLALERLRAAFLRPATVRSTFASLTVTGTAQVGNRTAAVVAAVLRDSGPAELFFDLRSGWLVRVTTSVASPLGGLPEAFDLDDYRRVGKVTIPFSISHLKPDFSDMDRFTSMKVNVPVDDATFRKPGGAPVRGCER